VATIVVVEPASPERERLVQLLGEAGHRVTVAADGAEALAVWRTQRGELAILDEGAAELSQRIKVDAGPGYTPVLLIVGRAGPEARAQALAVADDAVSRPFDPAELAARAAALLRTRRIVEELKAARAESEVRAISDQATGLRNRIFLGERLSEEWKRAARYNEPLSLILLSLDELRPGNDARGSAFVDRVLGAVAAACLRSLRQIDVVTRFGPGELAALLPNTHFAGSLTCAERLFAELGRTTVDDFPCVASMGIAFFPSREVAEPADLLRLASRALDRAREEGPGSICLIQHQGYMFHPKKA
jgi:diguanylate cyclase (GGDEF)-like protein